jgi:hypothetical protein
MYATYWQHYQLFLKIQVVSIKFLFSKILKLGFYVLKFFIHGKPKYITLDDLIPCNKNSKIPIFSKPIGNKIWVLLIEKAWAKCFGDFLSP